MQQRWQDYITTLIGVWVLFSLEIIHFFFPELVFTRGIAWSQGAVGFALIAVGASAVAGYQLWEEWVDVILGLWLIVSPLDYRVWQGDHIAMERRHLRRRGGHSRHLGAHVRPRPSATRKTRLSYFSQTPATANG
jgi:hypothetical protein